MGKLTIIFYVFVIVVLSLFACFTYLMTTVNPAPLVCLVTDAPIVTTTATKTTAAATEATPETPPSEPKPKVLMKLLGYEAEEPTTRGSMTEPPKQDEILINEIDSKPFNDTDPKKPKGRRSIHQRRKKNPGVVIMKVVDGDGRPRLEIVFHPKRASNDWKMYKNNNILGSKRQKTNLLRNSILNIMPDDTIVFDNNWGFDKISGDISNKTEVTKKVYDIENLDSNMIKTFNTSFLSSLYPEKYTSIENPHENITTGIKMDFIDEIHTISYKDISLENTNNLLLSTTSNLITASWKITDIEINDTETDLGSNLIKTLNHNEDVTEENIVSPTQLHSAQDTTMESPRANDTTKMKMNISGEVQTISHKEVSVENTDNLLHSTNPRSEIASWKKEDIGINKYGSSTDVFGMKDPGVVLTKLNLNEGTTQSNNILILSVQDTSSTESANANYTMKTEMGFSEETSNINERFTELSTDSLSFTEDTSPKGADGYINTQMMNDNTNYKEQTSENDMYINTDTLLYSTIPNITVDSSNEPDISISETPTTNAPHNEATLLYIQEKTSTDADSNVSSQMTIDNINEQEHTSGNDMYITDTTLNSTIPHINIDNEPDIWISETSTTNASHDEAIRLPAQDSEAPTTNASHDEAIRLPAQDSEAPTTNASHDEAIRLSAQDSEAPTTNDSHDEATHFTADYPTVYVKEAE